MSFIINVIDDSVLNQQRYINMELQTVYLNFVVSIGFYENDMLILQLNEACLFEFAVNLAYVTRIILKDEKISHEFSNLYGTYDLEILVTEGRISITETYREQRFFVSLQEYKKAAISFTKQAICYTNKYSYLMAEGVFETIINKLDLSEA